MLKVKAEEEFVAKQLAEFNFQYKREVWVELRDLMGEPGLKKRNFRLDFLIEGIDKVFVVECAEHQHKGDYDVYEESMRPLSVMKSMAISGSTKSLVYINYNPNEFKVGDNKHNIPRFMRLERLRRVIKEYDGLDLKEDPLNVILYVLRRLWQYDGQKGWI